MSKRGADEYITKEHGSTPNKQEESKVKMATAAQLAKRKMAAPKSRLNRTPAGNSTPTANPFGGASFGSAQPQQQQTFGSAGNGVAFGQSQSFPPNGSVSSAGFNFSVPAQSTSFTFGQPVQNNPFASINGNVPQEETKAIEDTVMESPQKKPAFGSGMFGTSSNSNPASSGAGLFSGFGQSTTNAQQLPSTSLFGQSQNTVNGVGSSVSSSIFGNTQSQSPEKDPNSGNKPISLFGQTSNAQADSSPSASTNGPFGPSTTQASSFSFGKPATDSPANLFSFGQSQSKPPTPETAKSTAFSFGQPTSESKPAAAAFTFGKSTSQPEPKPSTSTFSFGQSVSQPPSESVKASPEKPISSPSFSQFQASNPSNGFGGFGSSTVAGVSQSATSSPKPVISSDLTGTSTAPHTTSTPENPFAGLFGPSANNSPAKPADSPSSTFSFGAPAQAQKEFGISRGPDSVSTPRTHQESAPRSIFGSGMANTPKQSSSLGVNSNTNIFGGSSDAADSSISLRNEDTTTKPASTFSFGQTSIESKPTTGFNFGAPALASTTISTEDPVTAPKALAPTASKIAVESSASPLMPHQTITSTNPQGLSSLKSFVPHSVDTNPTSSSETPASTREDPKYTIYSNAPARIPPYLEAEKYKAYDSNYRLHSLNREFQKRMAMLDPSRDDLENMIRVYVAARESIGESIGLYTRNVAGMKRKGDQLDEDEDGTSTTKKARSATSTLNNEVTPSTNQFASSIFQPVPSSTTSHTVGSTFGTSATSSPAKAITTSQTNTPSLFKSMIPENASSTLKTSTPSKPGIAGASSSNVFGGNFKPTTGNSTTPPSSPPKKSGFQMPTSSTSSTSDFMSAFKKQSEASTAKFEKEAMEKRKAEDFDSDEDDEEAWTKKYEEEQRAKKSQLTGFKGFTPSFNTTNVSATTDAKHTNTNNDVHDDTDGEDDTEADADDEVQDDDQDDDVDAEDDEGDASDNSQPLQTNGKSLFDRISRVSEQKLDQTPKADAFSAIPKNSSSIFGNFKATPEAPSFSPITPSSSAPYKPSTTFSFTPTPRDSPTPVAGASVFEGGTTRDGPIPGEGLFGSRSSTPVNGESTRANIFGSLSTSQTQTGEDHTWKKGSAIKFGGDSSAPAVQITAPSPVKDTAKFGALFGMTDSATNGSSVSNPLGFSFGGSTSAPAPGFLGAVPYLAPGSGTTSGMSSRATSPGATDNESVATNESEDAQNDPPSTLLAHSGPYPGEEDEDIIFEARAKILRNYKEAEIEGTKKQKGWNVEGLGPMRVLKNKDTGKTRIVARAEPSANVVFNANLTPGVEYKATGSTVVVPVFSGGSPVQWMIKVKTPAIASELAGTLEKNRGS